MMWSEHSGEAPRAIEIESIYPLSPMQEGLVYHTLASPDTGAYVVQSDLVLRGALEAETLREAWRHMVERHAALRTLFVVDRGSELLQVVVKDVELPWSEEDLRGGAEGEQEAQIASYLEADRQRGFDLQRAPLCRVKLFRLGAAEYRMVWTVHHGVMDGWSKPVLSNELFGVYETLRSGEAITLPAARPYKAYITWVSAQDEREAASYWSDRLRGFAGPTALPWDEKPSGRTDVADGSTVVRFGLSEEMTAGLTKLAREHHLTMNTVVQGAWALLLSRYSGDRDVVYGVTHSGRPPALSGIERMVGCFVNTLPFRVDVDESSELLGWLEGLQSTAVEQREYEHVALVQIQAWSEVPRGTPLFETLFVYENYPVIRSGGVSSSLEIGSAGGFESTNYALSLSCFEGSEGLRFKFMYAPSWLHGSTVQRMADHLVRLLAEMASDPSRRLSELSLLSGAERHQLLTAWNDTEVAYPDDRCIHELFEAQVERAPDAVAVVFGEESLTYGALNRRANQLAHHLIARGVGPETMVGIALERSIEMVVGILGVLKAGGAYVPLDPGYPAERLAFMMQDTRAPVVLTQAHLESELPEHDGVVLRLDADWSRFAAEPETNPEVKTGPKSLAYAMYTSGSTGRPKGACIPHRSVIRLVWNTTYLSVTPADVFLQFAPISFDASTLELWGSLLNGAKLVVFPPQTPSLEELGRALETHGITTLWLTGALFQQMVNEQPDALAGVRQLLAGGDALSVPHVRRMIDRLQDEHRLINGYGPTENTTFTCCHVMGPDCTFARSVPIGRPIANTTAYIVDGNLEPVPVGVPGELYTGGDGLGRGYLNDPALTALRFVPNPFGEPGSRLYRTGDRARHDADGTMEFLGRSDFQVKLRGFRIELGEIETALLQETGVRDAVVLCREDEPGEKRLIAYVVPETAETLATGDLRSGLRERLPDYMMPTAVVILESMPINRNGKIDRSALPEPDRAETAATGFVAPGTPAEQTLAAIWSEVLRVERIGIHDNFFDLGGHSLLATQVISRVRVAFQQEIPLLALFDSPTVGELAAVIEGASGEALAAPPIVPVAREDDLPLSFAQQRLWFLEQLRPGEVAYHSSMTIRLRGTLDIDALGRSLDELVRRHETLRTTFRSVDGMPRQVIGQPSCVELELVDLTPLPEGERELEARRLAVEGVKRPFDLSRDPLMRTRLLRLGEREHVLHVVMHHIVTDGWSMGVLKRELGALYAAFVRGDAPPLAALEVQYADFSAWQRSWMSGEVLERQLDYWRGKLGGVGQLELPTDRPRPANQTFGAAHVEHVLPADLWYKLEALSQREGATPFMTLLGAFGVLLQRYASQDDIAVGSPIANRNRVETEGLIGFFVNTLVMRIDLSGSPTFRELLSLARSAALGAYQHQDVPFEKLVEELQPERDPSRNPLFQVMFAVQNAPGDELDLPALEIGRFDLGMGSTRFDLELHVWESAQGPTARFIYNTDLFDAGTIERMARHYRRLLDAIVADPDRRIADLPMLDDAERGLIVETWNVTATDYPRDACIHELFEAQAAQTPNAIALEFAGETLTYDALNRRANQVARHLIGLGVGPEVKVGICVERSLEMVVGILGILKAGGAYVPLDPGYPAERLSFMMRDTNAPVVLTLSRYEPELPKYDGTVLRLDADWPVFAAEPETNPAVAGTTATSLAYVIYTSGSTGRPKGVCVPHRAISRLVLETDYVALGPSDRMAHVSNVSFDAATFEIWGALLNGGTLVAVERDVALAPDRLAAALRDQRISVIFITTALFNQLAEFDGIFSSVRCVLFGGEAVDPARVRAVLAHGAPERLLHVYGPTENTTFSTWSEVRAVTPEATTVPIGRPIANTTAYVLDAYMNPVPIGVPGELYLGGDGLAHGYLDRAELTAARFVADPFSRIAGSRLYRTGDLVQYRADGDLEFVGRVDHQVKLRGFRIELGEIETALLQETGVRDAVVLCREDTPGDKRLVAYVTGENGESLSPAALRSGLGASLPDYMIPSGFVPMDQLPLTVNGKIDRAALPAPDGSHAPSLAYVEPSTETERTLAAIWGDVLHQDRVGIHDDFFYDLGGHSLVATRVVSRVRERFGLSLSLASIFDNPTVAGLAGLIDAEHREEIEL